MPGGDDEANPYGAFIEEVGALAMGATTYEWILAARRRSVAVPSSPTWVFTHRELPTGEGARPPLHQRAGAAACTRRWSTAAGDRNMWLVGGGELVGQFLDHDLLDEIWLSLTPVRAGQRRAAAAPAAHPTHAAAVGDPLAGRHVRAPALLAALTGTRGDSTRHEGRLDGGVRRRSRRTPRR